MLPYCHKDVCGLESIDARSAFESCVCTSPQIGMATAVALPLVQQNYVRAEAGHWQTASCSVCCWPGRSLLPGCNAFFIRHCNFRINKPAPKVSPDSCSGRQSTWHPRSGETRSASAAACTARAPPTCAPASRAELGQESVTSIPAAALAHRLWLGLTVGGANTAARQCASD